MATKAADPKHSPADEQPAADSFDAGAELAALREELKAELREELLAGLRADMRAAMTPDKPPLAMKARPHDRFVTEANGSGKPLKHWRCDSAVSVKVAEFDMDKLEAYESGELPIPEGKTALSASLIRGSWIAFVDGHCYTYTDNQNRNIERLRALPTEKGGMSGIYEDTGERPWHCGLCLGLPPFGNRQTWEAHVVAVHGAEALATLSGFAPVQVSLNQGPAIIRQ